MKTRVSVVLPTYHRDGLLADCLDCLARQEVDPSQYEIIVADDGACASTRALVEAFGRTTKARVLYCPVTGAHGPAAARNLGWRSANGAIIAFTDDDCLPQPRWLSAGLAALDHGAAAATGRVDVPLPDEPTDYERDVAGLESAEFVTANCFCRRDALEALGGFDERFRAAWREDSDLHFRLLRAGLEIVPAPQAVVIHPARPAPWGISLRQQRKTAYDALLYRKHPELYAQRIVGIPKDYYAMTASLGVAALGLAASLPWLAAAAALSWVTLAAAFCMRRLRGTSRSASHILEMAVTSALIPPLSLYWRMRGAWQFGAIPR